MSGASRACYPGICPLLLLKHFCVSNCMSSSVQMTEQSFAGELD